VNAAALAALQRQLPMKKSSRGLDGARAGAVLSASLRIAAGLVSIGALAVSSLVLRAAYWSKRRCRILTSGQLF
jgi:hypothetical protein